MFLFDFPESGKSACFGLGKDKDIPLCSPQKCVSTLDPQVGESLTAAAAFCGADWFFPRVFAAACAAASRALLFLLMVFVKWWDPLFLVSCMVLLGLFTLSSVLYLIKESNELFVLDSTAAAASDGDFALEERHSLLEEEMKVERGLNCSGAVACEFVFDLVGLEFVPESDREVGLTHRQWPDRGYRGIRRPDGWTSLAVFRSLQQRCTSDLGTLGTKNEFPVPG